MLVDPIASSVPCEGLNEASRKVFRRIPFEVRQAIQKVQLRTLAWVLGICPRAVITSSFRSPGYTYGLYRERNQEPNLNSLHAWGALDFRRDSVQVELLKAGAGALYRVVDEPRNHCVHVEALP